jgi:hypothetical protein
VGGFASPFQKGRGGFRVESVVTVPGDPRLALAGVRSFSPEAEGKRF